MEGRSDEQIMQMLDATHRAVLAAFGVPLRDRYQVVNEHKRGRMHIEDTGLGVERTSSVVVLQVTSRRRTAEQKQAFYRLLCAELSEACGIAASDVVISFVENTDADWSFAFGEAQYLTGQLS